MGKSPKTVTNKTEPPAWAVPYFQQMLSRAGQVSNQPFQSYGGEAVAGFTPDQLVGMQMTRDAAFGNVDLMNQGRDAYMGILSGGQSNPQLQAMIDASAGDVTRNFTTAIQPGLMGQFASGGAFGGSAHREALAGAQRELADELGQVSSGLRFNDWNLQNQRQMQALQGLGQFAGSMYDPAQAMLGIGGQQQGLAQAGLDFDFNEFMRQQGWDANQLNVLGGALGSITGGFQNNTGPNPNYQSPWQTLGGLGLGLMGLGI